MPKKPEPVAPPKFAAVRCTCGEVGPVVEGGPRCLGRRHGRGQTDGGRMSASHRSHRRRFPLQRPKHVAVKCAWCPELAPRVPDVGGDEAVEDARSAALQAGWKDHGALVCPACHAWSLLSDDERAAAVERHLAEQPERAAVAAQRKARLLANTLAWRNRGRLKELPAADGGAKKKRGGDRRSQEAKNQSGSGSSLNAREEAASMLGIGEQEARALETVFTTPVPPPDLVVNTS